MIDDRDRAWLEHAIALAARGGRETAPNPRVGAVVVQGAALVGEGWHERAGEAHAEPVALARAGSAAQGATLYVSLEPCTHRGRTPPCLDAIVERGIARVVAGIVDPDPRVNGAGLTALREHDIAVDLAVGDLAQAAAEAIEDYLVHRRQQRSFAALKVAATLDGRIADAAFGSRWITGEAARAHGRALRERHGAILVGVGTILADDPLLLPRELAGAPPFWRVVLDGGLRTPPSARLFADAARSPVVVFARADAPEEQERALVARGAEVVRLPPSDGGVAPRAVLEWLAARGVLGVLVEGGGRTHSRFLAAGVADKLYWYQSPTILGDPAAIPAVSGASRALAARHRFRVAHLARLGDDTLSILYPEKG